MAQEVTIVKIFPMANYAVVYWENNGDFPYVACWLPKVRNFIDTEWITPQSGYEGVKVKCYWEQGHYFSDKRSALNYAVEEEIVAAKDEIENIRQHIQDIRW